MTTFHRSPQSLPRPLMTPALSLGPLFVKRLLSQCLTQPLAQDLVIAVRVPEKVFMAY